jgi:hypothetical protein
MKLKIKNDDNEYNCCDCCDSCYLPKRKDRVITLRMDENSFDIVESYAKGKGLSVSAYINSVIASQTGCFIPLASNDKVSIPKSALFSLFSYASKDNLDDFAWLGDRTKTCCPSYLGRTKFTDFFGCYLQNLKKNLMGTDARIIRTSRSTDTGNNNMKGASTVVTMRISPMITPQILFLGFNQT